MIDLRGDTVKKGHRTILIILVFVLSICIKPEVMLGTETNVIKVGYPSVSGFTEVEEGIYTGYAYEYLTEIAKYTGWEYEFIEMSLSDLMYKLRDGEIDLAAGMIKNEQTEEMYDFPEENAGYTYTTLSVLKDNDTISGSNYETFHGIKVGYYETSKVRFNNFMKFCEENEIKDVELIPYRYDHEKVLIDALKAQEVDAIISGDLVTQEDQKVVAKFGPTPYYFATTKGDKTILAELNKALSKIKEEGPDFAEKLYSKYFKSYIDYSVHLTQEEQNYIDHMTPLKAVYVDDFAPMQDYNEKTMRVEGIYIDIMALIAQKSGLKYELVKASNQGEAYEMIKNKEADLIISVPDNYLQAAKHGVALTQAFLEVKMVKVIDVNQPNKEGKQIIALPTDYFFTEFKGDYKIHYYETMEECLNAVKTGEANLTYGNSYTISKYLLAGYYPNLSVVFEETPIKAVIGLSKPVNLTLLNIINKSISSLSESDVENIIYANTLSVKSHVTLKQFFFDNLSFCMGVIMAFVFLVSIVIRSKQKRLEQDKLFFLQKSQIDALTGVYNREAGIEKVITYLETKKTSLYSALIMVDIDHFKQVNDRLGHQVGDDVLKEFSQLLKEVFAAQDILLRLGGDEFIIFMTDIEPSGIQLVHNKLQQLQQIMDKEISYKENTQKISLSIGAIITNQAENFNTFYEEADRLLYEVKRNGRNGFKIKGIYE